MQSTLLIKDFPTVRARVTQKLREAIRSGTLKPGQRLVERELCEMMGVSRGLVNTVPHRVLVVSTSASK
ncbi:GntR family transcriptional regulator [Bradyrhizobium sp. USDA 4469]